MTYVSEEMRSKLAALFQSAGATPIELPILHHADLFVDLIGENIRRRLYAAPGANGQTMALRPEFTIPSCLHHLQTGDAARKGCYAYLGPVFRQREDDQPGEFHQAGIEMIDPEGGAALNARSLALSVSAVKDLSGKDAEVIIGDRALFSALLEELNAPKVWQRRLEGAFGERDVLDRMLGRLATGGSHDHGASAGLARILEDKAAEDVSAAVEEMLEIAGLTAVGGRSISDIAERYLEKAELAANAGWDSEKLAILKDYLDLQCSINDLASCLSDFESRHGMVLGKAKEAFLETCNQIADMLSAQDSKGDVAFKADFGRRLDYYSGFNFELRLEGEAKPVAGGGRYDRLLGLLAEKQDLGATVHAVPAVGFSIWLGRIQA
ncbi:ATP phosphoribosyltransferase regulatory subunit [Cohaesibacter gelatinilyticus]|uniref:ATP phosphoribosyltransferase regulatory subunit n=1 Tax=Cohaesibacter gelatinilyticus TaxID=372072 RepID=A0A285N8S3_9HYPH|nr:ATP phosphoribosyltransferase regulatory subunit [Cohaesibacter gelatinilyticus]SNZ05708.1 ATP phosphoribosyltransferase regulatory subunit [Cohaesibacter gelatinilyticus]